MERLHRLLLGVLSFKRNYVLETHGAKEYDGVFR